MHHHPKNQERAFNLSILTLSGKYTEPLFSKKGISSFFLIDLNRRVPDILWSFGPWDIGTLSSGISTYLKPRKTRMFFLGPPLCARCDGSTLLELATGLAFWKKNDVFSKEASPVPAGVALAKARKRRFKKPSIFAPHAQTWKTSSAWVNASTSSSKSRGFKNPFDFAHYSRPKQC